MARFHELVISELSHITHDAVAITFAVPPGLRETFRYRQGQHVALRTRIAGAEVMRTYSICSGMQDNELRIAVKRQPHGLFSNFANDRLTTGQRLEVMSPRGRFHTPLDPAQARHYLAFAAGSGITPILSIIKTTLAVEPASHFTLVYGNRTSASILFREELEDLKNGYMERFNRIHVLSGEHSGIELFHGRITKEKCRQIFSRCIDPAGVDECFICGPEPMMHAVTEALLDHGIEHSHIHFELFTVPGEVRMQSRQRREHSQTGQPFSRVSVIAEGRRIELDLARDTETILEAALRAGTDLPYSCKGGVCATCRAKVLAGKVHMDANYALEEEEIEAGYVLTCQSHPRSRKVVVDYDA